MAPIPKLPDTVLDTTKKKWYPHQAKSAYLSIFATVKWQALSEIRKTSTLLECEECHQSYLELQQTYPTVITINPDAIKTMGAKNKFTEQCTKDLDDAYQQAVGKTFVEHLVNVPKLCLQNGKYLTKKRRSERHFKAFVITSTCNSLITRQCHS